MSFVRGGALQGIFRVKSMFIGSNVRKATNEGRADYIPIFLSETPLLFRRNHVPLDVAMVQVTNHASWFSIFVEGIFLVWQRRG